MHSMEANAKISFLKYPLQIILLQRFQKIYLDIKPYSSQVFKNYVLYFILYINSLLPLGRYIDMDPSTTELVVSQTQFIRFGQFLLGWICDNQLHFPSIIAGNTKVKSWSQ